MRLSKNVLLALELPVLVLAAGMLVQSLRTLATKPDAAATAGRTGNQLQTGLDHGRN